MEGWQIRVIGKTFVLWFNPDTFEFKAVNRQRKGSNHGKELCNCM
ncbi:hypothetical protein [Clostridium saccharoperbutylacetonicum]